jgi:phosphohistidine phosphatase
MTHVLLVRHAEAQDRELAAAAGTADPHRALTPRGRKRMARIAPALAALVPGLDLIASSPLLRAVQTAELLAEEYPVRHVEQTESLAPGGDPGTVMRFLAAQGRHTACALVGHEPDLGRFASWALGGSDRSFIAFKKAGAALLCFPGDFEAGSAELLWLLAPSQLKRLARR